jgi:hypothetical protein
MKALVLFSMSPSQILRTIFQGSSYGRTPSGEGETKPLYWFRSIIDIMVGWSSIQWNPSHQRCSKKTKYC